MLCQINFGPQLQNKFVMFLLFQVRLGWGSIREVSGRSRLRSRKIFFIIFLIVFLLQGQVALSILRFSSLFHNYPAAHQDHCGRCRIRTQKSGVLPMPPHLQKYWGDQKIQKATGDIIIKINETNIISNISLMRFFTFVKL